jgi:predicted aldo/keto reductase-like oxidoreductase
LIWIQVTIISSNVNEQIQINDNIYIYDEINDLDLDELNTTNTLNHELTSGAIIIDIDDMGYEMPSKSMTVDENINDSVRNSPTLTEDENNV